MNLLIIPLKRCRLDCHNCKLSIIKVKLIHEKIFLMNLWEGVTHNFTYDTEVHGKVEFKEKQSVKDV